MATNFDPSGKLRPTIPSHTHEVQPHRQRRVQHQTIAAKEQPELTSDYDRSVEIADNMAEVLSQFRRRTEAEKKSSNSADPFERILEEQAEPKVEQLMFIAQSTELLPHELLVQARSMFPDDSDLILVLREIIKRRKLKNEDTSVLEEVLDQVWAETNQKHSKAGMNVGFKAQLFAKKMSVTPWSLRDTYRHFLTSDEDELSQYEQWVGQYGNIRRHLVAEFIESALLHDIQSHDPSCSRSEFGSLLNHVVNFKKLRSSDKEFIQVFLRRKLQKNKSIQLESDEEIALEAAILACWFDCLRRPFKIKKEIEKSDFAQLMTQTGLPKPELQQKLLKAIQLLDGDLFFDAEAKDILIDTLLNYQHGQS